MEDLPTHFTQGAHDDRPGSYGTRWMRVSLPETIPRIHECPILSQGLLF